MADHIGASIAVLHHPSKSGMRSIKETARADAYDMTGGAAALVNAPRFVNTMRWAQNPDDPDDRFRLFQSHKANLGTERAIKLVENEHGLVEFREEFSPALVNSGIFAADGVSSRNNSRRSGGRPSEADRTFMALEEMFVTHRREIALDELVRECVSRGIVKEAPENSEAWRSRRKTVRTHVQAKRDLIDIRGDGECFALKP
jgi:hypothetical protein